MHLHGRFFAGSRGKRLLFEKSMLNGVDGKALRFIFATHF